MRASQSVAMTAVPRRISDRMPPEVYAEGGGSGAQLLGRPQADLEVLVASLISACMTSGAACRASFRAA
jgi:hypothetical protein